MSKATSKKSATKTTKTRTTKTSTSKVAKAVKAVKATTVKQNVVDKHVPTEPVKLNAPMDRLLYVRDDEGRPIGCIAYETTVLRVNEDNSRDTQLRVAISTRNPKDPWVKSRGREVAQGRLRRAKPVTITVKDNVELINVVKTIVRNSEHTTLRMKKFLFQEAGLKFKFSGKLEPSPV